MSTDNPGTNITVAGDWSKPATVLIEKISAAIGGYAKPFQIRRVAHAEADAAKITAAAEIEVTELHQRAMRRFIAEETKKQHNIEDITAKALPDIGADAKPENMEDDWITNFFDKCRIISDAEMQSLWAKVLAGEANSPGSYSKRTVNFLASLDKKDASLFTSLCGFCWMLGDLVPLVIDEQAPIYNTKAIDFVTLTHLDNLGLVNFQPAGGYLRSHVQKHETVHYYGIPILLELPDNTDIFNICKCLLSSIGRELAPLCGSQPIPDFTDYVLSKWISQGLVVSSPFPRVGPH
jgi:hypothetical protein